MAYIGTPPSNAFTSLLKQDFSTSATTGYTLDHAVNNANDIALFINFVRQEPTAAYSASGTTLTLTSATASSDDMYCVYLGQALQTVNPPNASVGLSQLTATGTKDATTFLRGDNTFAVAGGTNTPYFRASMSSNQSISNETHTLVNFNTTEFESSSSLYDTTNKRFTVPSGQAGKYQISAGVRDAGGSSQANRFMVTIYVNGALADTSLRNVAVTRNTGSSLVAGLINLSVGDYIEVRAFQDTGSTQTLYGGTSLIQSYTFFTGYKIIE